MDKQLEHLVRKIKHEIAFPSIGHVLGDFLWYLLSVFSLNFEAYSFCFYISFKPIQL